MFRHETSLDGSMLSRMMTFSSLYAILAVAREEDVSWKGGYKPLFWGNCPPEL
jgi:hypothetical protein